MRTTGGKDLLRLANPISPMARIYPRASPTTTIAAAASTTASPTGETFTVWMRSLILHSKGLTVYNSKGEVVYRVDNYSTRRNHKVLLMDLRGKALCTLLRTRSIRERWDGYKCDDHGKVGGGSAWFQVRKTGWKRGLALKVKVKCKEQGEEICYRIKGTTRKSEFNIIDQSSTVLAEVKRKRTSTGVVLGDDVLSLAMEAHVDHPFVVALVTVVGLMGRRL